LITNVLHLLAETTEMSIIRLTDDLRAIGYDGLRTVADNVLTDPVLNETLEDAANDSKRMEVILNLLMRLSKPQFIQLIECVKVLIAGESSIISSLRIYTVEPELQLVVKIGYFIMVLSECSIRGVEGVVILIFHILQNDCFVHAQIL